MEMVRKQESWHYRKTDKTKRHWIWRDMKGRFIKKDISLLSEVQQKQFAEMSKLGKEVAWKVNSLPFSQQSKAQQKRSVKFQRLGREAVKGSYHTEGTKKKMKKSQIERWEKMTSEERKKSLKGLMR